jgi:Uma2 family endonuclease
MATILIPAESLMLLELQRIQVPIGQTLILNDVTWPEFERILEELGESRSSRIAYHHGRLEIMLPLPAHEAGKEMVGDFVKALLDELGIDFWALGSTTFKNAIMLEGIEPDQCFYIENEAAVRGKERLDLTIDPPPDLAIEIDITSRTHPEIYIALAVQELWRFSKGTLMIYVLLNGAYQAVSESPHFPGLNVTSAIEQALVMAKQDGRSAAMRWFRSQIRSNDDR